MGKTLAAAIEALEAGETGAAVIIELASVLIPSTAQRVRYTGRNRYLRLLHHHAESWSWVREFSSTRVESVRMIPGKDLSKRRTGCSFKACEFWFVLGVAIC